MKERGCSGEPFGTGNAGGFETIYVQSGVHGDSPFLGKGDPGPSKDLMSSSGVRQERRLARVKTRRPSLVGYFMRSLSAAFTSGLACRAPRTWMAAMVRRASSGVTSGAMVASPRT